MSNSTRRKRPRHHQSAKPYPDFPLTAHPSGRWCKKVRGKVLFFGKIDDPDGALTKWLDEKDELLAGRTPRTKGEGLTLSELTGRYMTHKKNLLTAGELTERTWNEYYATCERIVDTFGTNRFVTDLASDDFERLRASIAAIYGPIRLGNEVQRVRSVFKYGFEAGLIAVPVRFGPAFKRPSRKVIRKLRATNGPRMFEPKDIHLMLGAAGLQLKAMMLLGVNVGYGNEDCASLPIDAIDLKGGWVTFPRPKTGIARRAKLWPETVVAIKDVLAQRKEPADEKYKNLVFITKYGGPWSGVKIGATAITHETTKILELLEIKKPGLNFYGLRHSFRTAADGSRDQPAIDHIMGHARDEDMATHYRERIEDERLAAVADHVRSWLFPAKK